MYLTIICIKFPSHYISQQLAHIQSPCNGRIRVVLHDPRQLVEDLVESVVSSAQSIYRPHHNTQDS